MFEEGVAAPPREVPAGVVSLRNRWKRVLRPCHAPFHARPPICATSHRRDRLDRVRGYVCRKKRWGAEQTQMLWRGSEQTEPAGFSGPGREGRMVQSRRVSAIVILKSSPLSLSPFPPLWTFYWWLITSVDFRSGTRFYLKIFFFFLQNFFPPSNQLYIYQSNRCVLIQRGGRFKILYIYIFLRTLIRNIFYPKAGITRPPAAGINIQLYSQENRESPCCVERVRGGTG